MPYTVADGDEGGWLRLNQSPVKDSSGTCIRNLTQTFAEAQQKRHKKSSGVPTQTLFIPRPAVSPKAGVRLEPEVVGVPFQLGRRVRAPFILALLPGGLEPHDLNAQSLELRLPGRGDVDTRCRRSQAAPREQRGFQRQRSAFFFLSLLYGRNYKLHLTLRRGNPRRGGGRKPTEPIPLTWPRAKLQTAYVLLAVQPWSIHVALFSALTYCLYFMSRRCQTLCVFSCFAPIWHKTRLEGNLGRTNSLVLRLHCCYVGCTIWAKYAEKREALAFTTAFSCQFLPEASPTLRPRAPARGPPVPPS